MLFYYDYTYWMMLLPVLLITLYAQARVSSNFNKYSRIANRRHLTGAQAAEAVLRQVRPVYSSLEMARSSVRESVLTVITGESEGWVGPPRRALPWG